MNGCLGFLLEFVNNQCDIRVGDVIVMSVQPVEFVGDIIAQGRGNIDMVTANVD